MNAYIKRKTAAVITLVLLFIIPLVPSGVAYAQEPVVQQWVQRYNGPDNLGDWGNAIAVDSLDNVYVTGTSYRATGNGDYATIKYNSAGVQQWVQRYNGPGNSNDQAISIAVDSAGNVYVTGSSYNGDPNQGGNEDFTTIKYNSGGVQQWIARYDGGYGDQAIAIGLDGARNVYVAGNSNSAGGNQDYATVKYDSAGVQQWLARYDGAAHSTEEAHAMSVDNGGNVYVTGESHNGQNYDCTTVKYNSAGTEQWAQTYDGNNGDEARDIALDSVGNVYITGYSESATSWDYVTIKYNSAGTEQWRVQYNGPDDDSDMAHAIAVDSAGNVYVTGRSIYENITDYSDYATVKYNSAGAQQWAQRYRAETPDPTVNGANAIALDRWGNVCITGISTKDYATIKYSSAGVQQWAARYVGPFDYDEAQAIAVDSSSNVYVTGYSEASAGASDYATIKYAQQTVSVATATGSGTATFSTSAGGVADLKAVAQNALACPSRSDLSFPHGFFSFNIVGITPGSTVTITITLPSAMPTGTQYWKCINGSWVNCTSLLGDNDGDNVLILTIKDGGLGDSSPTPDGMIVDPGGPATTIIITPTPPAAPVEQAEGASTGEGRSTILRSADMKARYLRVMPQQAYINQPVTIATNVINSGGELGTYKVALKINDRVEQTRTVSVSPGSAQQVKFTVYKSQPGTYNVAIGSEKNTFTILSGDKAAASPPVDGGMIVLLLFGVLVLATILALIVVFRRPRHDDYGPY